MSDVQLAPCARPECVLSTVSREERVCIDSWKGKARWKAVALRVKKCVSTYLFRVLSESAVHLDGFLNCVLVADLEEGEADNFWHIGE